MSHLVLLATPLFAIVEDVVTGVIFGEQKGLLDLPLLSHQQEENQQEDWKSRGSVTIHPHNHIENPKPSEPHLILDPFTQDQSLTHFFDGFLAPRKETLYFLSSLTGRGLARLPPHSPLPWSEFLKYTQQFPS